MFLRGAEILIKCLLEQGVDTVFGYPGVSILEVYDELYKHKSQIRHILTAHEQGAAFAADGYARASGKTGVCFATSGPGATNLVTGIAAAFMDSSPVVFITCNVDDRLLGKDAFQEVDIVGISMPITKCSYLIDSAEKIAPAVREAFALARSGRKGPVLIDITHNAAVESAEYECLAPSAEGYAGRLSSAYREKILTSSAKTDLNSAVSKTISMLKASSKPLILCGGGVISSGAANELCRFARDNAVPVVSTLMGLGAMPPGDALYFGMAGVFGASEANFALQSCDLLIAVGARFSDRLTGSAEGFAPNARLVHIDIDRAEIDKNIPSSHHIIGDAKAVLSMLCEHSSSESNTGEWLREISSHRSAGRELYFPEAIIKEICRLAPEAFITTDVGQHQLWACREFSFSFPGQLITSGGYGAMGFGLGAALGVRAAFPERQIVHITGDGSFGMNMNELATELREKLPVITVLFENSSLGLVRQNQRLKCGRRYSQTDLSDNPDYVKLASAFGIKAERCRTAEEFSACFARALKTRSGLIICPINKNDIIKPMLEKGRLKY
jgi:acetolactate synthase-1/2/3 large subunit